MRSIYFKKIINSFLAIVCFSSIIHAQQAGDLDTSFGTNGITLTDISKSLTVNQQAIQPDGKIIVVGTSARNGIIYRYNTDGTYDLSFNGTGKIQMPEIMFTIVKVQADGKILVIAKTHFGQGRLYRFNADGSTDLSFGSSGYITNETMEVGMYSDIVIEASGKIILTKEYRTQSYYLPHTQYRKSKLRRYNIDGTVDTSFGVNGEVLLTDGDNIDTYSKAIFIKPNGKIVVALKRAANALFSYYGYEIKQFTSAGVLDKVYSVDVEHPSTAQGFNSMAIQPDNKLVVSLNVGGTLKTCRFNEDLTIDNSFGTAGVVTYPTANTYGKKIMVRPNGEIYLLANSQNTALYPTVIAPKLIKYNASGSLISTITYPVMSSKDTGSDFDFFNNEIVTSGSTNTASLDNGIFLNKASLSGVLNPAFDSDGISVIPPVESFEDTSSVSVRQPDGKIILLGISSVREQQYPSALTRYNTDGSLDPSFGTNGKVQLKEGSVVNNFALHSNGKLYLLCNTQILYNLTAYKGVLEIICLNTDGSVDTSFGTDGIYTFPTIWNDGNLVTTQFGLSQMIFTNDNKLLMGGMLGGGGSSFVFIRLNFFNNILSLDPTFDNDGCAIGDYNAGTNKELGDIRIQSDGKIIVGANAYGWDHTRVCVFRMNDNGSLDTTYATDGRYYISEMINTQWGPDWNRQGGITSLYLQPDNKVILTYYTSDYTDGNSIVNQPFRARRLNDDGTVDTTFGVNGSISESIQDGGYADNIFVTNDNKLIITGRSYILPNTSLSKSSLMKFSQDGQLETSFGNSGKLNLINFDWARVCIPTPDNKLIITGWSFNPTSQNTDFAISRIHTENALGTPENENIGFVFFPNPSNDRITFNENIKAAAFYSLDGKSINLSLKNNQIDISGLANGIYLVRATNQDDKVLTKKLIKN